MEKYFKLTTETKVNIFGVTLFRLELTVDCRFGKAGDNLTPIPSLHNKKILRALYFIDNNGQQSTYNNHQDRPDSKTNLC